MTQDNAGAMFDPKGKEGVKERPDSFPDSWPGKMPVEGQGVCGRVAGYDSFKSDMNEGMVHVLRMDHAVEYVPKNEGGGELYPTGEVGVIIGAGLRNRVGDAKMPVGALVSIRYTGVDAEKRNMRTYEVHEVPRTHLARLHEAVKGRAKRATEAAVKAEAAKDKAADDLPF